MARGKAIQFMLIGAPIFGAVGVNALSSGSFLVKTVAGALAGLLAAMAVWFVATAYHWMRAPSKQRDEVRAELERRKDLKELVLLEKQLRSVKEANEQALDDVQRRGLAGPLKRDETPWIKGENENMERWLPGAGFPELIPTLVLDNPSLRTWEDVQEAGQRFGDQLNSVLESDLFADVRHLDGLRFAQADEKRKLSGASKQLGTELRDIRHKIEVVRSTRPQPHYSRDFRLPAARWDEYDALLATSKPDLYPLVEAAYTAAHRVNEHLEFRRNACW
jgi:hypothetical protein